MAKSTGGKSSQRVKTGRGGDTRVHPAAAAPGDRFAAGKALRAKVPREFHAGWAAPANRPDPVDIITASNVGRIQSLVPIRHARMLTSSFAFLRGTAAVMAWDLHKLPSTGLRVQACGDCHLMNFGAFATPERNLIFDINDFDETLPAPWEWDVKRLAASVAVAALYIGLSAEVAREAARDVTFAYCRHMRKYASMPTLQVWYDRIDIDDVIAQIDSAGTQQHVLARIKRERQKTVTDHLYPKLVEEAGGVPRIKDNPPLIYHPGDMMADGSHEVRIPVLASYRETLADHHRLLVDRFRLRDAAVKVVGVGSVGTSCWVALLTASDHDPLFLQVKEANASVLAPYAGKSIYKNQGQRVVEGQRLTQAASDILLGWTVGATKGRHYYVRQLRDMKMSAVVEAMDAAGLKTYAGVCGWALARAHARSGDAAAISGYLGGGKVFSDAIASFAMEYAKQTNLDHQALAKAVSTGRINAATDF